MLSNNHLTHNGGSYFVTRGTLELVKYYNIFILYPHLYHNISF